MTLDEFIDDYERRTIEMCRLMRVMVRRDRQHRAAKKRAQEAHDGITQFASTADLPSVPTTYQHVGPTKSSRDVLREISRLIEEVDE